MAENICPICQRPNDASAERCWYCQAELTPTEQPTPVNGTDWLNGLREESVQAAEPESTGSLEATSESEKPEEVPDWLARIRTREQMEREAQANNQASAQPEPPLAEKKEELPDWLLEIKAGYSGKKSEPEEPARESVSPFAASSDEKKVPAASSPDQGDDTDEWLSRLAAWKPSDEASSITDEKAGTDESEFTEPESTLPPMESAPKPQFDLDSLAALNPSELKPFESNRGSGWQKLNADELESNQTVSPQEEKQLSFEDIKPPEEELPTAKFDINALRETIAVQQSNPDYFAEKAAPEEDLEEEDLSDEELQDYDLPVIEKPEPSSLDSLIFSETQPEPLVEDVASSPFVPDDLPDWLATAKLEKHDKRSSEPVSEELDGSLLEGELEKANLPAWLQAARIPTPDADGVTAASQPESGEEGLLAGIAGTLQTPSFGVDIRKPVGYGSALKVSERQKHSADLFANMVDETLDNEDVVIPKKAKNQRMLWRLLLAAAFLLIIFLSQSLFAPFVIKPALFPPEVVSVFDQVDAIPANKPVLLASDFEAAVAGELSWSSQSLLEHLMRRNLNLVILSTNPSGSTLMTQLIENAANNVDGYDLSTHVITLGYLPGGATGVQLLAGNPRAAMPYTHNLDTAWNSNILQPVNSMGDFGALIVLSDKSESSRTWVEQIQPGLGTTPLIFVISAQAAPLLQPYYQSGQISGYVAGFYGSLSYEQMLQQTSGSLTHLGAFQSAMLLAAALILVGGIATLIRPAAVERKG